jgi:hypothetical protein
LHDFRETLGTTGTLGITLSDGGSLVKAVIDIFVKKRPFKERLKMKKLEKFNTSSNIFLI